MNTTNVDIIPVKANLTKTIEDTAAGARSFLSHICMPAAKEFGLLLEDQVKAWRASNTQKVLLKAEQKYIKNGLKDDSAHPRLIHRAVEESSWTDEDFIQEMWAGLIVSSCTQSGKDDSNLWFMATLSELTASEARVITHICENGKKIATKTGLLQVEEHLTITLEALQKLTGINDIHRLDRDLDHLRSIELTYGGFSPCGNTTDASILPSPLCLQFYVRCQGYIGSPVDYFGLTPPTPSPDRS